MSQNDFPAVPTEYDEAKEVFFDVNHFVGMFLNRKLIGVIPIFNMDDYTYIDIVVDKPYRRTWAKRDNFAKLAHFIFNTLGYETLIAETHTDFGSRFAKKIGAKQIAPNKFLLSYNSLFFNNDGI